ncbi:MAG: tellurite resistance TerB family protein [Hyphomonadaceae bacterium]|jgi:uncharacterized membrane protein YebE (DUF533 family)|nr:tellurite resistance TerB family protein [Hyphomonadaceae bacterium]
MFDADKILRALQTELPKGLSALKTEGRQAVDQVKGNQDSRNLALGAGAAGLLGGLLLSGVGGKFGRKVATAGGIAALGALAFEAYKKHKGADAAGDGQVFLPNDTASREAVGKSALRAMIAAMKADGQIEATERARLFDRLGQVSLSDEEKAFLFDELAKPLDMAAVVAGADSAEMAVEIYAASLVAIDPERPAEKAYLADLASRLSLDPGLVANIHAEALAQA